MTECLDFCFSLRLLPNDECLISRKCQFNEGIYYTLPFGVTVAAAGVVVVVVAVDVANSWWCFDTFAKFLQIICAFWANCSKVMTEICHLGAVGRMIYNVKQPKAECSQLKISYNFANIL